MSESAEYKAAKLTRRNAKASLTRSGRALLHRITNQRSVDEVQETLANVEKVYNDLVQKHEKSTELIEEDKAFEVEEHWLEECQGQFLNLESRAKEYVQETLNEKDSSEKDNDEQGGITVDDEATENENTNMDEISSGSQVETPHNQNNEHAGQDSIAQGDIHRKFVLLRSKNQRCRDLTGTCAIMRYLKLILSILLAQNTIIETQLHFCARLLLENRWR